MWSAAWFVAGGMVGMVLMAVAMMGRDDRRGP